MQALHEEKSQRYWKQKIVDNKRNSMSLWYTLSGTFGEQTGNQWRDVG